MAFSMSVKVLTVGTFAITSPLAMAMLLPPVSQVRVMLLSVSPDLAPTQRISALSLVGVVPLG